MNTFSTRQPIFRLKQPLGPYLQHKWMVFYWDQHDCPPKKDAWLKTKLQLYQYIYIYIHTHCIMDGWLTNVTHMFTTFPAKLQTTSAEMSLRFGGRAKVVACSSSTKRYVLSGCLRKEQCPGFGGVGMGNLWKSTIATKEISENLHGHHPTNNLTLP